MNSVRFVFGLHLHQPVGNFDHVIEEHVDRVYRPLLELADERELTPLALHVSGPLLLWLETHERGLHDRIGRLAAEGRAELLTSGFYEPILASLSRPDRSEQLAWMHAHLKARFGVDARSAWLTERVSEPDLVSDLARAGVRALLVDDWHLMAGGIPKHAVHGHYRTEHDGRGLTLVPINEQLRYLIPFQPVPSLAEYLVELQSSGARLACLGDDGEKFGGWPGTWERVWKNGWIEEFADALCDMRDRGVIQFSRVDDAVEALPSSGLVYVPSASYREMGEWALPPELSDGAEHPFTSTHWKNFLVRYGESNRLHKKALALSRLCRSRGNPDGPRHAIGKAQCNDPYWHGVFGGIYMKHLRDAAWRELARAEAELRRGEGLAAETGDFAFDGDPRIWVHSPRFSSLLSSRTGRIQELLYFDDGTNVADVLTRRWEAYHGPAVERGQMLADRPTTNAEPGADDAPSIHDLENRYVLTEAPFVDRDERSLVLERVIGPDVGPSDWEATAYEPLWTWTGASTGGVRDREGSLVLTFAADWIEKTCAFTAAGDLEISYAWDPARFPGTCRLAVEISLAHPLQVRAEPPGTRWTYAIVTVPRAERGFERIEQGTSVTVVWPVEGGSGRIGLTREARGA